MRSKRDLVTWHCCRMEQFRCRRSLSRWINKVPRHFRDHSPASVNPDESSGASHAALLFGFPLPILFARGRFKCSAGIQLSSYAFAPVVTAGPSAPTTETWSAGSAFLEPPEERNARSPPLPPRFFWGKSVVIQVL